eukprot:m.192788 g.192788  ORF g.192788 m.192788 type:complete len:504 (+) comp32483_c0_seq1:97-1608(+)
MHLSRSLPVSPHMLLHLRLTSSLLFRAQRYWYRGLHNVTMEIHGHRGHSSVHDENTLHSIEQAFKASHLKRTVSAELDIQLTNDKQIIVLHDDTLERTARIDINHMTSELTKTLQTPVANLTFDQIKHCVVCATGAKVPLLSDFFKLLCKYPQSKLQVEIKSYEGDCNANANMMAALDLLFASAAAKAIKSRIIFISFDIDSIIPLKDTQNLADMDNYWVRESHDIANLNAADLDKTLFDRAKGMTGLDFESSHSLYALVPGSGGQTIIDIVKQKGFKSISWVNRGNRTDGIQWMKIVNDVGIDVFCSDLPVDVLDSDRWALRVTQTLSYLNDNVSHSTMCNYRGATADDNLSGLPLPTFVDQHGARYTVYCPVQSDFYAKAQDKVALASEILKDINNLSCYSDAVVVNTADLGPRRDDFVAAIIESKASLPKLMVLMDCTFKTYVPDSVDVEVLPLPPGVDTMADYRTRVVQTKHVESVEDMWFMDKNISVDPLLLVAKRLE